MNLGLSQQGRLIRMPNMGAGKWCTGVSEWLPRRSYFKSVHRRKRVRYRQFLRGKREMRGMAILVVEFQFLGLQN